MARASLGSTFFSLFVAIGFGLFLAPRARASVSTAVTFEALVRDTTSVGLATPIEQHAVWEGGAIFTYTRVHVESAVAGALGTGAETWVVTRGGVVGDVGQVVDGEAVLHLGVPSLLFLREDPSGPGAHVVTARAQGQFPIVDVPLLDERRERRFVRSTSVGMLLRHPSTARMRIASEVIEGRPVADVVREVAAAWKEAHAN